MHTPSCFQGFLYVVDISMTLLYSRMALSESELVKRKQCILRLGFVYSSDEQPFKDVGEEWQERLIGLYALVCCGGLRGLAIMITRAYFHWSGKWPRRKILLYIIVSSTAAFLGSSFKIFPVMRSYHGALCGLVRLIFLRTSAGVKRRGRRDSCPGASSYSSIAESKFGLCDGRGMKTCARW
jgi:hypothetical protein